MKRRKRKERIILLLRIGGEGREGKSGRIYKGKIRIRDKCERMQRMGR